MCRLNVRFEVDYEQIRRLEENMKRIPNESERVINDTLHDFGVRTAVEEITRLMPVSDRNKQHAKNSKWHTADLNNLSFTIKTRGGAANRLGSFGYLIFPEEGRGSSNPLEQRFARDGMKYATPKILKKIEEKLINKINEVL